MDDTTCVNSIFIMMGKQDCQCSCPDGVQDDLYRHTNVSESAHDDDSMLWLRIRAYVGGNVIRIPGGAGNLYFLNKTSQERLWDTSSLLPECRDP